MQPATIRRLLVFGVCLVAVSCLYLVPSVSGSSGRTGASTGPRDARTTTPEPSTGDITIPGSVPSASNPAPPAAPGSSELTNSVGAATQRPATQRITAGRSRPTATAVDARSDQAPPAAVDRLWSTGADPDQLGVAWTSATDDRGSVWYEVWVNGFNVTTTQQPEATLGWFNDSSSHVVQVRAVDLAGNRGPWSPTLMVSQPITPTNGESPKEDNS